MFSGVHDSLLTAYSVDSEARELVLRCEPHHGSARTPFQVVFTGVEAHHFPAPQLPAILDEIGEVPMAAFLESQWGTIAAGFRTCGWPGPWGVSVQEAAAHASSHGLRAFDVSSSYGLSGWVLAKSAVMVPASGA